MSKLKDYPLDSFSYPSDQIQEFGGIPQDTEYEYVSNTFLDGLVNYGRNHVAFMLARYGLDVDALAAIKGLPELTLSHDPEHYTPTEANYQKVADFLSSRMHFKALVDDWLVLYETDTSYFFMWYDQDSSDCIVERYSRTRLAGSYDVADFNTFVAERIAQFKSSGRGETFSYYPRPSEDQPVSILVRAANPLRGWISS